MTKFNWIINCRTSWNVPHLKYLKEMEQNGSISLYDYHQLNPLSLFHTILLYASIKVLIFFSLSQAVIFWLTVSFTYLFPSSKAKEF